MRLRRFVLPLCIALPLASLLLGHVRADDDHTVINVVNDLVYVDLGTRDGALVGKAIEVIGGGKIKLDMCGEAVCRGKLPLGLKGSILKGMRVRLIAPPSTTPTATTVEVPSSATSEPSTQPSTSATEHEPPPPEPTTPPKKKKKAPKYEVYPVEKIEAPRELPPKLPYTEGSKAPDGYRRVTKSDGTLKALGWTTMGISFGLAVLVGGLDNLALAVPVLGPWIRLATPEYSCSGGGYSYNCSGRKESTTFLVADGIAQAGGLALLIAGYSTHHHYYLRNDIKEGVMLVPMIGPSTYALGIVGSF